MDEKRMTLSVLVAQPGSDDHIRENGLSIQSLVDSGATTSIIPLPVVRQVYGGGPIPYGENIAIVPELIFGPMVRAPTVPLTIGLETAGGGLLCAQIDCLVSDRLAIALIGSDVLNQLGLRVTLDYRKQEVLVESYNWISFEEEVAAIYRSLGGTVKRNVTLAGFQIDMVVEETTASKQRLRLAVECKFYKERVGNRIVNDFARVVETLKQSGLADKGVIVSSAGFTQDATLVAEKTGIDLLTIDDLRQVTSDRGVVVPAAPPGKPRRPSVASARKTVKHPPRIFVVMPFTSELDDVYHLGIREVAATVGGSCERADEIQYVGGIVEKIYASIKSADLVIAEMTAPNPNVYYEVGFAHALGLPVVLLARDLQATPFDLRGYNHVLYSSIVDLRRKLERILRQVLSIDEGGEG